MIYAIGDIHGKLGLLVELLSLIRQDAEGRGITQPRIVILGDIIDRGSDSRGVIDLLISESFKKDFEATILLGNHDEWLLRILAGEKDMLGNWLHYGGAETIESYGVEFGLDSVNKVFSRFLEALPLPHINFLKSLPLTFRYENWFFVHAGVKPGVPLDRQRRDDLLWIFDEFLNYKGDFGAVVVHGHATTESQGVEIFSNRIAVDTGAGYPGGKLSAVALENGIVVKSLFSQ